MSRSSSSTARAACSRAFSVAPVSPARQLAASRRPAIRSLELGPSADPQLERQAGRAQRLVDAREHAAQRPAAVRREQLEPVGVPVGAEGLEGGRERLAAQDAAVALVEHAEARVEAGRERMRLEQPVAEAVDGRDPGAVERPREVVAAELVQPLPDAQAQLAGRPLGVRDHEHRVDVEAVLAHRAREALDQHRRLARAGARGDEDEAARVDRGLLLAGSARARPTRGSIAANVTADPLCGSGGACARSGAAAPTVCPAP